MESYNLEKLLNEEDYIIVLDTNVYLDVYKYFPDYSKFAITCLDRIKDYVYIPSTVLYEYEKHKIVEFKRMANRIKTTHKHIDETIDNAKSSILSIKKDLEKLQFNHIDEFINDVTEKFDELLDTSKSYFEDDTLLKDKSLFWGAEDKVEALVESIKKQSRIMPSFTGEEILRMCDEGEKRYKKKTPPGYEDAKDKDGARKYSDYFIWKEMINFAKNNHKNIIFVTGDVKEDWWEAKREFHSKLVREFSKTGQAVKAYETTDFYSEISKWLKIDFNFIVDEFSKAVDSEYCKSIFDNIEEYVTEYLQYRALDFIDEENAHIGTEGIDEFLLSEIEVKSYERTSDVDDYSEIVYNFIVHIVVEGTSYEYWGRDDETREIILSYGTDHTFEGDLTIEVERECDLTFDLSKAKFSKIQIVDGELEEVDYNECAVFDEDDCEYGVYGNCPDCDVPLNDENDGANGFCVNCGPNH